MCRLVRAARQEAPRAIASTAAKPAVAEHRSGIGQGEPNMSLSSVTSPPSTTLYTGSYSSPSGDGTFARVIQQQGDSETISTIRTSSAGKTTTNQTTIIDNTDGTVTRDSTSTNAQGQTVQRDLTLGVSQGGTRSVSGTVTDSDGSVDQVSGTIAATSNGFNEALSLSNSSGQTATSNVAYAQAGSVDTNSVTGTNFLGGAINQQTSATTLSTLNLGDLVV
jgi:hypothetical protein